MTNNNFLRGKALCAALFVLLLCVVGWTNALAQPQGALNGLFSVSDSTQVRFSQGNLQYRASNHTWRFASNQWDYVGSGNTYMSSSYSGWIDLFGWGTSGYNHGATSYQPWSTSTLGSNYYAYANPQYNLYDQTGKADWGYNAIGDNPENSGWRTLTKDEWNYVFNTRNTTSGMRYAKAQVNGVKGVILLPNNWSENNYPLNSFNTPNADYTSNTINATGWQTYFQTNGAVFLPAAGTRGWNSLNNEPQVTNVDQGFYWASTASSYYSNSAFAYILSFGNANLGVSPNSSISRSAGCSVRLVCVDESTAYTIDVSANPANGGTVNGGGTYDEGATCTVTATPNSGYTFTNWTENGTQVSTNANYSFTVNGNRNLVANFTEQGQTTNHWTPNASQYANTMTVVGIIQIDGEEQFTSNLELGAFCGEECRGSQLPQYYPEPTNHYLVFLTLYGNDGNQLSFRLYDHATNQELDLTCATTVTFSTNATLGSPGVPYVFNFTSVQDHTASLSNGWNWWSTYIEQTDLDGLSQMEESLGAHGITIKSRENGFVTNYGNQWYGSLTSINNESTYLIQTNAACEMTVTGHLATASAHPTTLPVGWSWIGYPCSTSMSVSTALSGLTPVENDQVKSREGFAVYYPGVGWMGTLQTINPGTGLMFESRHTSAMTLTYPTEAKSETLNSNITAENNHWVPAMQRYPYTMTMLAVVELDGKELESEQYELGVFADGECRGSMKLMQVEALGHYLAFVTVYGDEPVELSFGLYDSQTGEERYDLGKRLMFAPNATMGSPKEPYRVEFATYEHDYHWTPESSQYSNTASVIGVINIDGVEQAVTTLELGAFCGEECRGRDTMMYVEGLDRYILFLTLYGNDNDELNFRLYDHNIGEELNLTCDNTITFVANGTFGNPGDPYVFEFVSEGTSYTITVSADPVEGGVVTGEGLYAEGEICNLTATANEGYSFVNWTKDGDEVSTTETYSFTVTEDGDYVAHFNLNSYEISAMTNPLAGGTITGAGTYNYGEEVTLTVTPNPNYVFDNWTEDGTVVWEEASYTFTVTGDRVLFANLTNVESIGEQDGIIVSMYPNPVSEKLTVEVIEPDATLEIFNLDGALIYKVKNCPNKIMVEISSWSSGTYILRLTTKSSSVTRKFVKE